MAILTQDAAVRSGHGCCAFLSVKLDTDKNSPTYNQVVPDPDNPANGFYTGRVYPNKIVQITSGFTVAAEGTVTGNLETTNWGPITKRFVDKYLSMKTRPGQAAQMAGMETLTDETGSTDETSSAGGSVPINEQLIAIQFGGEFMNSMSENSDGIKTWYILIHIALVSLGNETASVTHAANTYGRRNWTLNGQTANNDIDISLSYLQGIFNGATAPEGNDSNPDIGINILNILDTRDPDDPEYTETLDALTLEAKVGLQDFILEVSTRTEQGF